MKKIATGTMKIISNAVIIAICPMPVVITVVLFSKVCVGMRVFRSPKFNNNKMKVEIELIESPSTETQWSGWKVTYGDKYADGLGYDEMLGLVAAITLPEKRPTLQWLKTAEQHQQWRDNLAKKSEDIEIVTAGS